MQVVFVLLLFSWNVATGQDCLFFYPNSTQLYTTAFIGVPEDVEVGSIIATADARIALRITLKPVDDDIVQRLLTVLIRDNTTVQVIVAKKLTNILPYTKTLNFHLQCTGPSGAYSSLPVLITVLDINDHAPVFEENPYEAHISEFHGVGIPVIEGLRAIDGDLPNTPNTEVRFSIAGGNELGFFAIRNPREGVVFLEKKVDYEAGPRVFYLNISATDRGTPALSNWTIVIVYIVDEDDQNPVFERDLYEATLVEEIDEFKAIITVHALDGDLGLNETLRYEIVDGLRSCLHHFIIDHVSGTISLLKPIDREQMPASVAGYITLIIQAAQKNDPTRTAKTTARIFVEDINDNGPRFVENHLIKTIDLPPSVLSMDYLDLAQLTVFDRDTTDNAVFNVHVESNRTDKSVTRLLLVDPTEGTNQSIFLRVENITALLQEFGVEFSINVVAVDSLQNRRTIRSILPQNVIMHDTAVVHIKFNSVHPGLLQALDDVAHIDLPADAKAFMAQYAVTLLIVFGASICVLLLVIVIMAGAYHKVKKRLRIRPKLFSDSVRSSITVSPISINSESNESQA